VEKFARLNCQVMLHLFESGISTAKDIPEFKRKKKEYEQCLKPGARIRQAAIGILSGLILFAKHPITSRKGVSLRDL
jgi:hypothetical protein